jgi:uncharacterized glyoxalase superfamily protein PhnB
MGGLSLNIIFYRELTKEIITGGKVTMELQEMFWGAYYGSCTDKYGVQWMFNCVMQNKTI